MYGYRTRKRKRKLRYNQNNDINASQTTLMGLEKPS